MVALHHDQKFMTQSKSELHVLESKRSSRYILLACPWGPKGGGMFKVSDYLIQSQDSRLDANSAELVSLDTRGNASAIASMWVLTRALIRITWGRASGQLAGVHVNMAERLSLFRKGAIVVASKMLGVPVVLHLHAAQLHTFYPKLPRPLQALTRWVFTLPECCIVLGTTAERFVVEQLHVPKARVEIVINGVPAPTVPRRIQAANGVHRILFVGNLNERKGVTDLLRAVAYPGFNTLRTELVLAGGGDVQAYTAKAVALGIEDRVKFIGWTAQKEVAQLMAQADILVLPSYDEGLPLVILEAMANGVAVVCSPVGEIPSLLHHNLSACFVQPGDVKDLSTTLQQVLEQPQLRETLEKNGRALYLEKFSMVQFFSSIARIHTQSFGVSSKSTTSHAGSPKPSATQPRASNK